MFFEAKENALIASAGNEIIRIEPWGTDALRVRITRNAAFSGRDQALLPAPAAEAEISVGEKNATIRCGKLSCRVVASGWLEFFKDGKSIVKEYSRNGNGANEHSNSMRLPAREFSAVGGNDYAITARFEAYDGEKLFGMGQYQQPQLNLKGCILELAQRNSQISVPFCLSNRGYGFLWNNPAIGEVTFGNNYTQWRARMSEELDYWITAGDTPREILSHYTEVTGRAPVFPEYAMGLWQCKLRYRTQEEVLAVAREYKRRGIPLDVIVIDYFHWVRQGDWGFDPDYWPDPAAMVKELREMGVRCMVSVWPTVDQKSVNYKEAREHGYLVRAEHGEQIYVTWSGKCAFLDMLHPEARRFIFDKINRNYVGYGIENFWLDEAEPEYAHYDYDEYRHYTGPALKVGNEYPRAYAQAFYEGLRAQGKPDPVSLIRCAWCGSQRYGALTWSGDVRSTFTSFRDQVRAGLNIGIAGIPWWTTDTGGFIGNINDSHFRELLIRWFQFSVFSPVLRMHGDRGPHDIPPLSKLDYGGGFCPTGQPNELWSYGEEVYAILRKYLDLRLSMKDYIASLYREASENGSPLLRTLFYEFPEDAHCWEIDDEYLFGARYLVAPVLYEGMTERDVYLPDGRWRNIHTDEMLTGGQTIRAAAPLDVIPVFERLG